MRTHPLDLINLLLYNLEWAVGSVVPIYEDKEQGFRICICTTTTVPRLKSQRLSLEKSASLLTKIDKVSK